MCVFLDLYVLLDLAPGNDEIHEEKQEVFLTPGNPQEGQVILYKVLISHVILILFSFFFLTQVENLGISVLKMLMMSFQILKC